MAHTRVQAPPDWGRLNSVKDSVDDRLVLVVDRVQIECMRIRIIGPI